MNAIKQISAQAKKLQRANQKLSWRDAIKKASAMYRSKKTGKVGTAGKPAAQVGKKKVARKKAAPAGRHTDTKSHNVNIRVMSGTDGARIGSEKRKLIAELDRAVAMAKSAKTELEWHRRFMKTKKYREMDSIGRDAVKNTVAFYRKLERQKLDQVAALKKLI